MKSILIAATIVGASAAALILYMRHLTTLRTRATNVIDAASQSSGALKSDSDLLTRPSQHAMG